MYEQVLPLGLLLMSCSACFFFLNTTQDHQPNDDTIHSVRSSPINHQLRKYSTGLPIAQSYGSIFLTDVPPVQMTLGSVKLT